MTSEDAPARGRAGRWAARLALSAIAAAGAFLAGFGFFLWSLDWSERSPPGSSDAIVALTGGADRIEDAIVLLARGYGSRLLITGVNERTSLDGIKRLNPEQRAALECCVDLDHEARNTVGNATATSRWARAKGFRSLVVVTSNYHLPRAMLELDAALPEVRKTAYAVIPSLRAADGPSALLGRARLFLGEYAKYLAVWVRTRLVQPGPAPTASASLADRASPR